MLHLVALSFEHRRGNQIDAVFPEFPDDPWVADWLQGLPFIAIPDKAHGACSSTVQFTLPRPGERNNCLYGLAAFRSINASELVADPAYVRNQVQKSLCVISKVPLFGELEELLKRSLYDNFDSLVQNLDPLFCRFRDLCQEDPSPFAGISYPSLFQSLQLNVLTLVKAILSRHSILIFADNSEMVSKMVCAVASLLPGFIYDTGYPLKFLESQSYSFSPYVPLQFTETLNRSHNKCALMGTCSELFMDRKVVEYDILVDCRTIPATVKGSVLKNLALAPNEVKYMKDLLFYLKGNWDKNDAPLCIRNEFLKYVNSVLVSMIKVRHIKLVHEFAWKYLDWEFPELFGKAFIGELLEREEVRDLIRTLGEEDLVPVSERLLLRKR
jgi:hypothetical protein